MDVEHMNAVQTSSRAQGRSRPDPDPEGGARPSPRAKRVRLPLHIPVTVLFSLLILGVGASISLLHFHHTSLLLEATNQRLFRTLADDVREALLNAERTVRRAFILLSASPLADAAGANERLRFLPELTGLIEADPLIDSVMVGYGDGGFFLLTRSDGRQVGEGLAMWTVLDTVAVRDEPPVQVPRAHHFDRGLRFLGTSPASQAPLEPRLTQWYRRAAASNRLVVSAPYAFRHSGARGLTFAQRNGSAVLGINVDFAALSALMARQSTSASTLVRVLARDRALIAGHGAAAGAGDAVIAQALDSGRGDHLSTRVLPDASGRNWQVAVAPLPGLGDEGWTLAIAVPDDEIFAHALRQRERSILLTVLAVLLSFPLAWGLSRMLTKPLHRLSGVAHAVSSLQFQREAETHSVILEVDRLAGAIAMMRSTIARFIELGRDLGTARDVRSLLLEVRTGAREVAQVPWCAVHVVARYHEAPGWIHAGDDTDHLPAGFEGHPLPDPEAPGDGPYSVRIPALTDSAWQVLFIPLRTGDGQALGTLVLADRAAAGSSLQRGELVGFLAALAGSAAIALENQRLLDGRKDLLQGVMRLIAEAIDAKSSYTGGHCRRVPQIATRLARAAHAIESGPLAAYRLDASGWEALQMGAWMHDCGKLTTPDYVIDKATKLETLHNRIHEIRTRFEVLKRDAEVAYWKGLAGGFDEVPLRRQRDATWRVLDEEFAFVARCNCGEQAITAADVERLHQIAGRRWTRTLDERLGLSNAELERLEGLPPRPLPIEEPLLADRPEHVVPRHDSTRFRVGNPWGFSMRVPAALYDRGELHNLTVTRGTLTAEERFKINEHIVETILMLERLPFPPDLAGVPEIAGGHHETMDGQGYPRGLGAAALSVNARIIAIADIFEALTAHDRPYKTAHSVDEALAIMRTLCARQVIDADLFELFVACRAWHEDAPCSADAAVEDWAMPTSTAPSAIIGPFRPHDPSP
jgi:HD-GYP domain-containing protein (c-di-GMP phosphodiesterase class II)